MTRLTRFWLASLVCKVIGHDELRVVTKMTVDPLGNTNLVAGYEFCKRCDVTLRTWGE